MKMINSSYSKYSAYCMISPPEQGTANQVMVLTGIMETQSSVFRYFFILNESAWTPSFSKAIITQCGMAGFCVYFVHSLHCTHLRAVIWLVIIFTVFLPLSQEHKIQLISQLFSVTSKYKVWFVKKGPPWCSTMSNCNTPFPVYIMTHKIITS